MSKGSLREDMPVTAQLIDNMRAALGVDYFNAILVRAMNGEPGCFFSEENGRTFGTPFVERADAVRIGTDAKGNRVDLDNPNAPREPRRGGGQVAWQAALDEQAKQRIKG